MSKKRLLSVVLVLAMCLGMLPGAAFATAPFSTKGEGVTISVDSKTGAISAEEDSNYIYDIFLFKNNSAITTLATKLKDPAARSVVTAALPTTKVQLKTVGGDIEDVRNLTDLDGGVIAVVSYLDTETSADENKISGYSYATVSSLGVTNTIPTPLTVVSTEGSISVNGTGFDTLSTLKTMLSGSVTCYVADDTVTEAAAWTTATTKDDVEAKLTGEVTDASNAVAGKVIYAVEYNDDEYVTAIGEVGVAASAYNFETAYAAATGHYALAPSSGAVEATAEAADYKLGSVMATNNGDADYVAVPVTATGALPWDSANSGRFYGFIAVAPNGATSAKYAEITPAGTKPTADEITTALEGAGDATVASYYPSENTGLAKTTGAVTGVRVTANAAVPAGQSKWVVIKWDNFTNPVVYQLSWTGAAKAVEHVTAAFNATNTGLEFGKYADGTTTVTTVNVKYYVVDSNPANLRLTVPFAQWTTATTQTNVESEDYLGVEAEDDFDAAKTAATDGKYIVAVEYDSTKVKAYGWVAGANQSLDDLDTITYTAMSTTEKENIGKLSSTKIDGVVLENNSLVWYVMDKGEQKTLADSLTTATTYEALQTAIAATTESKTYSNGTGKVAALKAEDAVANDGDNVIYVVELSGALKDVSDPSAETYAANLAYNKALTVVAAGKVDVKADKLAISTTTAKSGAAGKVDLAFGTLTGDVYQTVMYRVVSSDPSEQTVGAVPTGTGWTAAYDTETTYVTHGDEVEDVVAANGSYIEAVTLDKDGKVVAWAKTGPTSDGKIGSISFTIADDTSNGATTYTTAPTASSGTLYYWLWTPTNDAALTAFETAASKWTETSTYSDVTAALTANGTIDDAVNAAQTIPARLTSADNGKYLVVIEAANADFKLLKYGKVEVKDLTLVPLIDVTFNAAAVANGEGTIDTALNVPAQTTGHTYGYYLTGATATQAAELKKATTDNTKDNIASTTGVSGLDTTAGVLKDADLRNSENNSKIIVVVDYDKNGNVSAIGEAQITGIPAPETPAPTLTFKADGTGIASNKQTKESGTEAQMFYYKNISGMTEAEVNAFVASLETLTTRDAWTAAFSATGDEALSAEKTFTNLDNGKWYVVDVLFKTGVPNAELKSYVGGMVTDVTKLYSGLATVAPTGVVTPDATLAALIADTEHYTAYYYANSASKTSDLAALDTSKTQTNTESAMTNTSPIASGTALTAKQAYNNFIDVVVYTKEETPKIVAYGESAQVTAQNTNLATLSVADVTSRGAITQPTGVNAANTAYYTITEAVNTAINGDLAAYLNKQNNNKGVATWNSTSIAELEGINLNGSFGSKTDISSPDMNGQYLLVIEYHTNSDTDGRAVAWGVSVNPINFAATALDPMDAFTAVGGEDRTDEQGIVLTKAGGTTPFTLDDKMDYYLVSKDPAATTGGLTTLTGGMDKATTTSKITTFNGSAVTAKEQAALATEAYAEASAYIIVVKYADSGKTTLTSWGSAPINWAPSKTSNTKTLDVTTANAEGGAAYNTVKLTVTGNDTNGTAYYKVADSATCPVYVGKTMDTDGWTALNNLPENGNIEAADGKFVHVVTLNVSSQPMQWAVSAETDDGVAVVAASLTHVINIAVGTVGGGDGSSWEKAITYTVNQAYATAKNVVKKDAGADGITATNAVSFTVSSTQGGAAGDVTLTDGAGTVYITLTDNSNTTTYYIVTVTRTAATKATLEIIAPTEAVAYGTKDKITVKVKITNSTLTAFDASKAAKSANWTITDTTTGLALTANSITFENNGVANDTAVLNFQNADGAKTGTLRILPKLNAFASAPQALGEPAELTVGEAAVTVALSGDAGVAKLQKASDAEQTSIAYTSESGAFAETTVYLELKDNYTLATAMYNDEDISETYDAAKHTLTFTPVYGATALTVTTTAPDTVTVALAKGTADAGITALTFTSGEAVDSKDYATVSGGAFSEQTVYVTLAENYKLDTIKYGETDITSTASAQTGTFSFKFTPAKGVTTITVNATAPDTVTVALAKGTAEAGITALTFTSGEAVASKEYATVSGGAFTEQTVYVTLAENYKLDTIKYGEADITSAASAKEGTFSFKFTPAMGVTTITVNATAPDTVTVALTKGTADAGITALTFTSGEAVASKEYATVSGGAFTEQTVYVTLAENYKLDTIKYGETDITSTASAKEGTFNFKFTPAMGVTTITVNATAPNTATITLKNPETGATLSFSNTATELVKTLAVPAGESYSAITVYVTLSEGCTIKAVRFGDNDVTADAKIADGTITYTPAETGILTVSVNAPATTEELKDIAENGEVESATTVAKVGDVVTSSTVVTAEESSALASFVAAAKDSDEVAITATSEAGDAEAAAVQIGNSLIAAYKNVEAEITTKVETDAGTIELDTATMKSVAALANDKDVSLVINTKQTVSEAVKNKMSATDKAVINGMNTVVCQVSFQVDGNDLEGVKGAITFTITGPTGKNVNDLVLSYIDTTSNKLVLMEADNLVYDPVTGKMTVTTTHLTDFVIYDTNEVKTDEGTPTITKVVKIGDTASNGYQYYTVTVNGNTEGAYIVERRTSSAGIVSQTTTAFNDLNGKTKQISVVTGETVEVYIITNPAHILSADSDGVAAWTDVTVDSVGAVYDVAA